MTSERIPEVRKKLHPATETGLIESPAEGRRKFFNGFGKVALSSTAALLFGDTLLHGQNTGNNVDTPIQILTAALIAEDLASTFYYNGLVGPVIQDPDLAGPGGSATSNTGNVDDVTYLRAALGQEIAHANLFRTNGNLAANAAADPYQTFYFPAGTFDTLPAFLGVLAALENAFIGAYLTAIQELGNLSTRATIRNVPTGPNGGPYSGAQLNYYAKIVASILGVECEHRVLGATIGGALQPNNLNFESTAGLTSVFNGPNSAVAALTPFLTPTTGPGFSLATALAGAATVSVPSTGNPPAQ